jgi:rSAM/selenodomain-associated transferase 2
MNRISIIIPILNEAETISVLLEHLMNNSSNKNISEILVIDGGSTDGSQEIVSNNRNVKLLSSNKGRAKQMNLGAKNAKGDIFYFLHADSLPPKNFDSMIIKEVEKGNLAGCFKMKFNNNHWWLKLAGWLTKFNWRACRGGDQSQFITKALFDELNGFDERFIIYEDNDLINKLYAKDQFVVIQEEWLITSSRKYQKYGIWKLQYYFWVIYIKKWFGASPEELHQYYLKNIS